MPTTTPTPHPHSLDEILSRLDALGDSSGADTTAPNPGSHSIDAGPNLRIIGDSFPSTVERQALSPVSSYRTLVLLAAAVALTLTALAVAVVAL